MKNVDYKKILDYFVKVLNDTCKGKIYIDDFALRGKYVLIDHPIVEISFITHNNYCMHVFGNSYSKLYSSICATTCHKYFNKLKHILLNYSLFTNHTVDKPGQTYYMIECLQDLLMMNPVELMVKADLDE